MRKRHRDISGFTLLELILVMLILTIMVGLIAPSLRWFGVGRGNNDAASLVVSLGNYARTQAASEGRTYRLNLDPASRSIWLTAGSGAVFQPLSNDFGRKFTLSEGSRLRTDIAQREDGLYVEFQPTGRTEPAKIWLTDKLGEELEVACASPTELYRILPPGEMTR